MRYIRRLLELYPGTIPDKQEKEPKAEKAARNHRGEERPLLDTPYDE